MNPVGRPGTTAQGIFGGLLDAPEWGRRFLEAWGDVSDSLAGSNPVAKGADRPMAAFVTPRAHLASHRPGGLSCTVHGDIYNGSELVRAFGGKVYVPVDANPADIILAGFLRGELPSVLKLARGSFVFSLLDEPHKKLVLGRDRYGGRLLYYAETTSGLLYSSRLAPLARLPWISRRIDPVGLMKYFAGGYVTAPHTILAEIKLLPPGHLGEFEGKTLRLTACAPLEPASWGFHDLHRQGEQALLDHLERLLLEAVQCRLPASGKAAVYLSGGADTSLITGILKRHTGREVTAFTLGLSDSKNDESDYARAVAEHLEVKDHRLYRLTRDDFLETFEQSMEVFGQPFSDISALPTMVITRKVAGDFESVFCGDGPDFMFGNFDFKLLYYYYRTFPPLLRNGVSRLAETVLKTFFSRWMSPNLSVPEMMRQPEFFWIYQKKFKAAALGQLLNREIRPDEFQVHAYLKARTDIPISERLLLAEHLFYGMDDVLCKATGAHDAWGVSLLRPFYDQPLFDFCRSLPTRYKFRKGRGRYLQKHLLARYLPAQLIYRPKRGFIIDFVEFGVDSLKHLTDRYLTRRRLEERGLINADYALRCVEQYYQGNRNLGPKVWTLLVFEAWREAFGA
jgi:asparagine synthase (glutamine-hydrolysing)